MRYSNFFSLGLQAAIAFYDRQKQAIFVLFTLRRLTIP
jgi:hypothetical protein